MYTKKPNIVFPSDEKIKEDFPNSFHQIIELTNSLLPSSPLINEAILLGSAIDYYQTNGLTSSQMNEYLGFSLELLKKIKIEFSAPQNDGDWEKVNKIRNHFLGRFKRKQVFKCINITKSYPRSKFCLDDISFTIKSGEILGILGENGNGKTTLLKIIAGLISQDKGTLEYFGMPSNNKNTFKVPKKDIAYIPQKIKDWGNIDSLKTQLHFNAAIKGIYGKENTRVVDYFIQRLNLEKYKNLYWREVSGGIQLRFEIAKALLWKPQLIILDEPLANLDVKAKAQLLSDLRNITNSINFQTSIIISSQNIFELEKTSDKIIFLKEGKVLYSGLTENIGVENNFNCFQIETNWELNKIKQSLKNDKIFRIEDDGHYISIFTSKEFKKRQILQMLLDKEIQINYFRDISNSTRIFFESKTITDEKNTN